MKRAHKIKLRPNEEQLTALKKAAGCSRFAYNWALEKWKKQYDAFKKGVGSKPTVYSIAREWTVYKPKWAYESPKAASQRAILNVGRAYNNFWNGNADFPTFKKKNNRDSFYVNNDRTYVKGKSITLPKIGNVKMWEELRFQDKIMGATVSYDAGDWFVSIHMEIEDAISTPNTSIVGVDVGVQKIAIASDGSVAKNPKPLKRFMNKLKRAARKLSRKKARSKNYQKALINLQKIHRRIRNIRSDVIHKFTSQLAKNHGTAVIETLGACEMKHNIPRWMHVVLQDTNMTEVHRQLEYKMRVFKAPKYYPSSRTCSKCGQTVNELSLSCRVFKCKKCGFKCDRDLNASYNLRNMRWVTPSKPVELLCSDEAGSRS